MIKLLDRLLSNPLHAVELVDGGVSPVLGPVVDDPLGNRRADAWQVLQLRGGGSVDIEEAAGGGRSVLGTWFWSRRPGGRARR